MPTPDFDELADILPCGGEAHPSALHGLACGILAAGFSPEPAQWLGQIAGYLDWPENAMPIDSTGERALADVLDQSLEALESGDFSFQPCLPDDDVYSIVERSESLARWCEGFLHGFAAVQLPLGEDSRELLGDLTEIARLEIDDDVSLGDETESDYAELCEFVRMAVISLFLDTRLAATAAGNHHVQH